MPVRKISKSNAETKHLVSGVTSGGTTKVKRVTLGKPVRRVNAAAIIADLSQLNDVQAVGVEEGGVLVYSESDGKWHAQKILDKQEINGGQY